MKQRRVGSCLRFGALALVFIVLFMHRAAAQEPVPSVVVTPVVSANIAPSLSNIGHVIAIQSVKILPRVTAFIDEVNVQQGSTVKAGQLLFSLQTAQYQAALQTAQANLASAQAALENAQLVYARAANLKTSGFESQSSLDQALATRNEDRANVLAAQASLANAQLNLSYCTITAPIAGRIGAVALTKGNLVTSGTGSLVTINQLDPIRVVFSVSNDSPILSTMQNSAARAGFALSLDLPSGAKYHYPGKIAFLDNQVDSSTGTVNVYADFPNPQSLLLPGAYVSVLTRPSKPQEALMVPVAAVQTDQSSDYVLVVGQDNKVAKATVSLGQQIGQNLIVNSGVKLNDRVIVDGIQKVKVGQAVSATVAPAQTQTASADSASQ
jgi:membrane fusion protein (multidrug efflux system)